MLNILENVHEIAELGLGYRFKASDIMLGSMHHVPGGEGLTVECLV